MNAILLVKNVKRASSQHQASLPQELAGVLTVEGRQYCVYLAIFCHGVSLQCRGALCQ